MAESSPPHPTLSPSVGENKAEGGFRRTVEAVPLGLPALALALGLAVAPWVHPPPVTLWLVWSASALTANPWGEFRP